ncbi:MAG: 4Fe-4S binding protein, partial [Clostridiales bacterium]|nr:4Fe-4S binding protein [Clostridiales bacterium]
MKKIKLPGLLRMIVLLAILVYVTYESYMHQVLGGGKAPSVHALCPFGALESLYAIMLTGTFVQKIYSGTVVLLVLTVILALLFRRSFCGMLCPFGALQELFARIGIKIFKKRFVMPGKIDRPMRYLKYAILVLTVGMAWYTGTLWMSAYDPYSAYAHITSIAGSISEEPMAIIGFILLGITIVGSLLYDRFFCKYLCPAGAFYGIIGKLSPTKVVRDEKLCINCKACNKACPVNINVAVAQKVTDAECINCNECVLACPKKGALEVKTAGKRISPLVILIAVVGLFFATILISQAAGIYQVLPSKPGEGEIITIAEIKVYYTIEEAAKATGMSVEELYTKLGIPEEVPKTTQMKNISTIAEGFSLDEAKANEAAGSLTEEAGTPVTDEGNSAEATSEATSEATAETTAATVTPGNGSTSDNGAAMPDVSAIKG